jgi:hypothetical protein
MEKMREIYDIVIHCDANDNPTWGLKELEILHVGKKYGGIGYHAWIDFQGVIHKTRYYDKKGAHVAGFNTHSLGFCLHGLKNFTTLQKNSLKNLVLEACLKFKIPPNRIYPHNYFTYKDCPNFDIGFLRNFIHDHLKEEGK